MRPAYCARIQSSLNRLPTSTVTLEKSSATWAIRGLIQVLNCCSGRSCASCSTQACHRPWPASAPGECWGLREGSSIISGGFLLWIGGTGLGGGL
ncbi:hypothetical protein D3C71_994610 [compost metagenome]